MKIFDKEFKVELIEFEDKSIAGNPCRSVTFKVDNETYFYNYGGGPAIALSSVHKIDEKGIKHEVYSCWKHFPNGSYYQEIGRILSIEKRQINQKQDVR